MSKKGAVHTGQKKRTPASFKKGDIVVIASRYEGKLTFTVGTYDKFDPSDNTHYVAIEQFDRFGQLVNKTEKWVKHVYDITDSAAFFEYMEKRRQELIGKLDEEKEEAIRLWNNIKSHLSKEGGAE